MGASSKFEGSAATVGTVRRDGHDRQIKLAVGQSETKTKCSISAQLDEPAADRHFRIRLRGTINDQLRIDVEPEGFPPLHSAKRTGPARDHPTPRPRNRE